MPENMALLVALALQLVILVQMLNIRVLACMQHALQDLMLPWQLNPPISLLFPL